LKCISLSKSDYAFAALTLIALLSTFMGIVIADNANFTVQPQNEHAVTLSLHETDRVSGSFSVVSDDESGINFYVSDPQNKTILRHNNIKQKSFSFTAEATGDYQLHFDNSVSSVYSKTVALNYNITQYIMGMPQEQFLFLVIAAIALIGVLIYVVLLPK